jgi:signal transduction histidine kinase
MRIRTLPLRLLVPAGLVVLVGVLATLEYRWLGQVSEADRDRRRASLQQHADEFADDFDRELLRLYMVLQGDSVAVEKGVWGPFASHLDSWRETAREPRILRAVYLVDGDPPNARVRAFHSDTRTFIDAAWPDALLPIRDHMTGVFKDSTGGLDRLVIVPRDPIAASIPALVVNLSSIQTLQAIEPIGMMSYRRSGGFLIAHLDQEVLQSSFLPALAARYFPERDADLYRLAIVDAADRARPPILARGVPAGAAIDPAKADARVSLFALRFELAPQVVSLSTFTRDFNVGFTTKREVTTTNSTIAGAPLPRVARDQPIPSESVTAGVVATTGRAAGSGGRGAGGAVTGLQGGRGFQIVLQTQPGDIFRMGVPSAGGAAWQLVLQHAAGSLDMAVNQARRRNLWLSFGILGVLGAGVCLIVINAQRSERLAAQQMDFVATVSHELRTPLAVIRSAAQNLSAGVVLDAAQAKKYGEVIDAEGRRLTDMVEQVLEYAGLSGDRRPLMARPVDAGAVAREALASCEALLPGDHFEIEVDVAGDLPFIVADEGAIRRALQNLITNALKYGADGRWLGLSVKRGDARRRDEVQITVADRGRGIDAADLPHIFEAFYRGRRAVDEQIHGNGLGLSLVKRIAEAHGGRVTVKSSPGEGTAFTVHLPSAKPTESHELSSVPSEAT